MHRVALLAKHLRPLSTAAHTSLESSACMAREGCRIHLQDDLPQDKDPRQIIAGFRASVNMTPQEVERWLGTEESRRAVEATAEDADREGRHAARRVVELLGKDEELFYEGDLQHAWQITSYIRCHKAALEGRAEVDPLTVWHLRNFGFDPLKERAGGSGSGAPEGSEKRQRLE